MALVANCSSRVNGTAVTSEVVFSMPMVSLPVGGMMMRMACGSIDAAHDERAVHAQCLGRLGLARVHGFKAGTHDFGQVGGLVQGQTNPLRR